MRGLKGTKRFFHLIKILLWQCRFRQKWTCPDFRMCWKILSRLTNVCVCRCLYVNTHRIVMEGHWRRIWSGLQRIVIVFKMNLLLTLFAAVVNTHWLQMKKLQYFCNHFSRLHFIANTIKIISIFSFTLFGFFFTFFFFLHTKIINILCFTFHFCTKQQTIQIKWDETTVKIKEEKHHWTQNGRKKHSMFQPGPRTLKCIQITWTSSY